MDHLGAGLREAASWFPCFPSLGGFHPLKLLTGGLVFALSTEAALGRQREWPGGDIWFWKAEFQDASPL